MSARIEIGYVCRHGHFYFDDDPDGDACQTKRVGRIFVEAVPGVSEDDLQIAVDESIASQHDKVEFWRRNAP